LTVAAPPTITKAFGVAQIPLNGTTSLTFTIANPPANVTLTGIAFTDNLPAGLVVATPNGLTNTCGGAATAVAGSGSVSLSAVTLAASASCTVSVNVQGAAAGIDNNSVQVTSTEGGTGNTSNASITVVGPPVIIKAFGAASVALNGSTSLTFTIQNNNTTTALSGIGFSDTLPAGLVVSTPNGLAGTCGGGTITATQATNVISLSGATLAQSTSCNFSVNVTGTTSGIKNNTTGNVTSTEGGTGGTASASLSVVGPPSIAKAFNPIGIPANGVSTLTVTLTNPAANNVAENGVAFTDNFPAGLVVATPNGLTNTCGGTATATAGSGTVSLVGGTIAVNSTCTVGVNVTSSTPGSYLNTTGAVSSTNGGTGNTASATLNVASPPTITKNFSASAVALNGIVSVSFGISNPNASVDLTGIQFTDALPVGLVVAAPNGLFSDCGGAVTATPGSGSISLAGGAVTAVNATCTVNVNLRATTAGIKNNTTGPISANESGPGTPSNTATLEVVLPPTLAKVFGAASIPLGGTTSLTFTATNPNTTVTLVNTDFSDFLPAGLVVAAPNGVVGTCVTNNGAAVTANPGSNSINATAFNLPPSSNCTLSVNVTGTSAGTKNNTSGNITASFDDGSGTFIGITGNTASASIAVAAPPSISKSFNPAVIAINTNSALTFTVTNPAVNTIALTGVSFTDTLPAGVVVATPNGLAGACGGGTITATAGSGSITLTGATLAPGACTFSVNVTSATAGTYTNTTGPVSSTNGGTGNTATAVLTVTAADITITKTHVGNFFFGQVGASYTITVSNVGIGSSAGTITVVDTVPALFTPTAMSGTGWACTVATATCTRSDALANGASYPPITLTGNIGPGTVTTTVTNTATVSGGGDTNPANNVANNLTTIVPLFITITPGINAATVSRGQTATFTFTVNASVPNAIALLCSSLPAGTSCSFNPPVPASNGSTNETMSVTTTAPPFGMNQPQSPLGGAPVYVAMVMTLPMVGLLFAGMGRGDDKRKKKSKAVRLIILGVILLGMLLVLSGCGGHAKGFDNGNGFQTHPGTYVIPVTATNGNISAQTSVTLTVTP
ncbi:MAG TPA: hypothetical protein VK738_14230, partial [Terriglobales bacterium]|nr:hypothetical protein [Terriglobales bacterium]